GCIGVDGLDFALAEQSALGVDLLRRKDVTLQRWLAEHGRRAGQEGHVAGLEGLIWNFALRRFGGRTNHFWASHKASAGKTSSTDCDAERTQQVSSVHWCWFVHIVHEIPPFDAHLGRRSLPGFCRSFSYFLVGRTRPPSCVRPSVEHYHGMCFNRLTTAAVCCAAQ